MKLVILDRDGTINATSDEFIKSPEEWHPIEGALEAIGRLNHAGYHVVLATNQAGLGRGLMDVASLNAIHVHMNKQLAKVGGRIDAIFIARMHPMRAVRVANRHLACCCRLVSVMAFPWRACLLWVTACETCGPPRRAGAVPIWCCPASLKFCVHTVCRLNFLCKPVCTRTWMPL